MKETVLFCPTRGNEKRLHKTAQQFSNLGKVVFLATDLPPKSLVRLPHNCEVIDLGSSSEHNLRDKRNLAIQMARDLGLSYCLQSDDDLGTRGTYSIDLVAAMLVNKLEDYPYMGAVSSYNFSSIALKQVATPISHEFVIKNFPNALFALRLEAIDQTGDFTIRSMEDIEIGCKLWEKGWIVGGFPELTWSHNRPRKTKKPSDGGLPLVELAITLPEGVPVLEKYSAIKKIVHYVDADNFSQHRIYWNWKHLVELTRQAGINYRDSKFGTGL